MYNNYQFSLSLLFSPLVTFSIKIDTERWHMLIIRGEQLILVILSEVPTYSTHRVQWVELLHPQLPTFTHNPLNRSH